MFACVPMTLTTTATTTTATTTTGEGTTTSSTDAAKSSTPGSGSGYFLMCVISIPLRCGGMFNNRVIANFLQNVGYCDGDSIFTRGSCTGRYCWERVLAMGILSVCPSVCLSDTTRYRLKAMWDRDSGFSPYDSLESLVSYEVLWCQWVRRFPSNEGIKRGTPL